MYTATSQALNKVLPCFLKKLAPKGCLMIRNVDAKVEVEVNTETSTLVVSVPVQSVELNFRADPNDSSRTQVEVSGAESSAVERVAAAVREMHANENTMVE